MRWCAVSCTGAQRWKHLLCIGRDDFIFGIPDDRADDLEQLMREAFKVKICERIGPGFSNICGIFLHRKVAWNAEGFSWTHVPKHTLAMADAFGLNGKKQLEQTKWISYCGTWFEDGGQRFAVTMRTVWA